MKYKQIDGRVELKYRHVDLCRVVSWVRDNVPEALDGITGLFGDVPDVLEYASSIASGRMIAPYVIESEAILQSLTKQDIASLARVLGVYMCDAVIDEAWAQLCTADDPFDAWVQEELIYSWGYIEEEHMRLEAIGGEYRFLGAHNADDGERYIHYELSVGDDYVVKNKHIWGKIGIWHSIAGDLNRLEEMVRGG